MQLEVLLNDLEFGKWRKQFAQITHTLIRDSHPVSSGGVSYIDIVKDVINLVPVRWIADEIVWLPCPTLVSVTLTTLSPLQGYSVEPVAGSPTHSKLQRLYEVFTHISE